MSKIFSDQRQIDLLRYARHLLFTDDLISPEEYAALVTHKGAVARLEEYDAMRAELTRLRKIEEAARGIKGHWPDCPASWIAPGPCDCGYEALRKALETNNA